MSKFSIKKSPFGQEVYFNKKDIDYKICNILVLKDEKSIEITTDFFERKTHKIPIYSEVELEMDRNSSIIYHHIDGVENILLFKGFENFGELKIGKTPYQIQRFLTSKTKYSEIFTKCKSSNRNIYFFVRHLIENKLDFAGDPKPDEYTDNFLIGAYLYDPEAEKSDLYAPLTMIYCTKVFLANFEK